jgi:hypothetical protein
MTNLCNVINWATTTTTTEAHQCTCALWEKTSYKPEAWARAEREKQMWTEVLTFPGVRMGWALSWMEVRTVLLVQMGWALLWTEALHMRGHAHSLWQTSHQVLPAYLIACPQHRDQCEPGGTCP